MKKYPDYTPPGMPEAEKDPQPLVQRPATRRTQAQLAASVPYGPTVAPRWPPGAEGVVDPNNDSPHGASLRGAHQLADTKCERLLALRYFWQIRAAQDNIYRMGGTMIHIAYMYRFASLLPESQRPSWFYKESMVEMLERVGRAVSRKQRTALIHMARENVRWYDRHYASDRVNLKPISIEEEYFATVGELDPGGPFPELDNEIVSVRADLVYANAAGEWIMDYKSHGNSKVNKETGKLRAWRPDGEFGLDFQVLLNLKVLRLRRGATKVRGFIIQRTTRQAPWDADRYVCDVPRMAYDDVGRSVRMFVKREEEIRARTAQGLPPAANYSACQTRFGPCDYKDACRARDKEDMLKRLRSPSFTWPDEEELRRHHARLRVLQGRNT